MIVLSLFDGISCGKEALDRAGIHVDKYYASEIDPHAISVSEHNHKNIIRLGDVNNLASWKIPKPDLIIAGSPCTNLSMSGNRLGLNGKESGLYYRFLDCVKKYKPKHFLLENVKMAKIWEDKISKDLNVSPSKINSSLVSAQSRARLYWTNIPHTIPVDKKISLSNILETDPSKIDKKLFVNLNNRYITPVLLKKLMLNTDKPIRSFSIDGGGQGYRVYSKLGKSITLCASGGGLGRHTGLYEGSSMKPRRLTINECERLQTLPNNYVDGANISEAQKYKCLGNGWTIDVISHILKNI